MTITFITVVILSIAAFLYALFENDSKDKKDRLNETPIIAKRLLTDHEKVLFNQLIQLPNCHVFVQVSLAAFLHTNGWKTRNRFIRKIADFVVTDSNLNILAVIELDDKSHDDKQAQDKARDDMLKAAGYKVLRYRIVPSPQQLTQDILTLTQ